MEQDHTGNYSNKNPKFQQNDLDDYEDYDRAGSDFNATAEGTKGCSELVSDRHVGKFETGNSDEEEEEEENDDDKIVDQKYGDAEDFQRPAKLDLIVGFLRCFNLFFLLTMQVMHPCENLTSNETKKNTTEEKKEEKKTKSE